MTFTQLVEKLNQTTDLTLIATVKSSLDSWLSMKLRRCIWPMFISQRWPYANKRPQMTTWSERFTTLSVKTSETRSLRTTSPNSWWPKSPQVSSTVFRWKSDVVLVGWATPFKKNAKKLTFYLVQMAWSHYLPFRQSWTTTTFPLYLLIRTSWKNRASSSKTPTWMTWFSISKS